MSSHLIHRQELEILISDKSRARQAQDRIASLNQGTWLPVINKTLDRLYGPNTWVYLDRVEIDIGALAGYSSSTLERKLEESLISSLKKAERENRIQKVKLDDISYTELTPNNSNETNDPILFYLRTGSRKWSTGASINPKSQLRDRILSLKYLESIQNIYIEIGPPVLDRISAALQWQDMKILLSKLTHQSSLEVSKWLTDLSEQSQRLLATQNLILNTNKFEKICLRKIVAIALSNSENSSSWNEKKMENLLIFWLRALLLEHGFSFKNIGIKEIENFPTLDTNDVLNPELNTKIFDQRLEVHSNTSDQIHQPKIHVPDEGLLCLNAGISLIWPYLPAFFKAQGWVQQKTFTSTKSIGKAILCLHFMANGTSLRDESEAIMYKLLCGLDFNNHLDLSQDLSDAIKKDANELLRNVIENWKALKGTSIPGLREGWLQRTGRLKSEQNGYVLEMESSAIDILLDKVTWPISTIMLPWNKKMIHVKWK